MSKYLISNSIAGKLPTEYLERQYSIGSCYKIKPVLEGTI
nr:MAG TPA: hypothetical protein [Caudoviricetes sp.]